MAGIPVGQIARRAQVDAWTVRFYEKEHLLPKARRSSSGYRLYEPEVADRIRFIKKAQHLGLSLKEIREILQLSDQGRCPCGHVEQALRSKVRELRAKIEDLKTVEARILEVLRSPVRKPSAGKGAICQRIEQHQGPSCCPSGSQQVQWVKEDRRRAK